MTPVQYPIATLATGAALEDLRVLLRTLEIFNRNPPTVYLYCDTLAASEAAKMGYKGALHTKDVLGGYSAYDRRTMESMPGKAFKTLWMDFMTEKINLLRWALKEAGSGVLFCDADICFMASLPAIPIEACVALSPHGILERDEQRFGKYNGGFAWFSAVKYADLWWDACATARYYEQSALEDVAKIVIDTEGPDALYEFPKTHNYGWWRLWQGVKSPSELLKQWAMNRTKDSESSGLCVDGSPVGSVHTHFFETTDAATKQFNAMILAWLNVLSKDHTPARRLLAVVGRA